MKKFTAFFVLMLLFAIQSCRKEDQINIPRDLDAKNLTPCPATGCTFLYKQRIDFNMITNIFSPGVFRVFYLEFIYEGTSFHMYIKAPMDGVAFSLSSHDLTTGKLSCYTSCSSCRLVPLIILLGEVRGQRIPRDDQQGPELWVVDARLEISSGIRSPVEQLHIKQIFYPDFVMPN